jgi:predicted mannosyl-3-phosphoglycerate phosphatase (HAD superfamily)
MRKRIRLTDENDPLTQTEQVLAGFEQVSKLASQQVEKSTSQDSESSQKQEFTGLDAQQVSLLGSQQVDKSVLKKATFQIDSQILQQLDRLHLKFQMENGKAEAPYKEVIVEEAIARFLAEINDNEAQLFQDLSARQKIRDR